MEVNADPSTEAKQCAQTRSQPRSSQTLAIPFPSRVCMSERGVGSLAPLVQKAPLFPRATPHRTAMQSPKVKQAAAEQPFLDLFSRHTKNRRRKLRDAVYRHIESISPLSRQCSAENKVC